MNQPETFAQLLAKATPGPFKAARSHEDFDGPMFDLEEGEAKPFVRIYGGKEAVFSCHDLAIIKDADAELIARLLNFAHAGGVIALRDALDRLNCANERAARSGVIGFRTDDLEHALVILNGQTK